ncbi:hypothetical protein G3580_01505 [Nitrogeniibacter mangrovi]|uniref:FecR protein domain-containing protein n=1 Tax=Nitrogeniibacter mangrovi TaxID=2016596 RepID=A0A6C1AYK2_9RHOO|nr:FecR domain-containing protein [Nitrogeniibacter mangrovi]QID16417.1 hypothetical protein G3580_01505 [Nitrogeniibacter mangrovi]
MHMAGHAGCRWVRRALMLVLLLGAVTVRAGDDMVRYVVRKDDTLIGLGEAMFADPSAWPQVQRINRVANPRRIPIGTVLSIPVRLLRTVPREGEVVFVSGQARADGASLATGDKVPEGARLETGADGFLSIALPDGSHLTLQPQSRVRVEGLHGFVGIDDAQRASFEVDEGRVETEVAPQKGPAARYRIHTPTAIIGVRGTSFRVAADAAVTRAEMREGTVQVAGPQGGGRPVALREGFGLVARAGKPLPKPVALLPAPDLTDLPTLHERPLVSLELAPLAGAIAYRGQVATDAGFSRIVAEARSAVPVLKIDGLADGDYFLRVRGVDSRGLEGRDAQMAFRLKARPEPPFVNAPRPDGKVRAGEVAFAWARAEGAARYRFELSRQADLSEPLVSRADLAEPDLRVALEEGTYYWRLASTRADGDRGPWGDPVRVTVRPPMAPVPPPAFDDTSMFFAWGGEPGQRFEYQLADDTDFATVLASGTVAQPEVRMDKPAPGAYYLRIRAIDPDGFVSAYSAPQKVIVPASFPVWLIGVPLMMIFL